MGDLSIKVTIANRVYPLTIKREEEENIRKAAKLVSENMNDLEENYAVRDRQDLLAMTALQFATQTLSSPEARQGEEAESLKQRLQQLDHRLDHYLDSV
ncbi:MAG: cell division protein ZapA [Bacteroidota bacterium]